jgi:hypothetical protein
MPTNTAAGADIHLPVERGSELLDNQALPE